MSTLRGIGALTNIAGMFIRCNLLYDVERNIKNLNVENVKSFESLFYSCLCLKSIDLSAWNT